MEGYLGIDLGTSCIKTVFLEKDGEILAEGSSDLAVHYPKSGYAEQNPADWWSGTQNAIQNMKKKCPQAKIKGIGISGQMLGSVLLDKDGMLLDECIIWQDQRADQENEWIKERLGLEYILDETANYPLVSYWAPKLLWLKGHKLEIYQKTAHVLFPKDYLKYKLTGNYDIDVTDASGTMLFDTKNRCWNVGLFDKLGIKRDLVPESASESTDVIGYVTEEAADFLGIPKGIPVVAGGGDQMCGAVGLGVVEEGVVASTIGTSGCVFSYSKDCPIDRKMRAMLSYCHSVPGSYCVYGCTLSAGGSFSWLRDTLFEGKKTAYEEMTKLAEKAAPGSEGLLFLPYLNGERTPHPDPDARGIFFGLSVRQGKAEIVRSVMEGVTYSLRDIIEIMREEGIAVREVRAAGGGASSRLWLQMQADIFHARVAVTNVKEAPATGAAMLAAAAGGAFQNLKEAAKTVVKVKAVQEPDAGRMVCYDSFYESYVKLYDTVCSLYKIHAPKVREWGKKE